MNKSVIVIGGALADIMGSPTDKLIKSDSNPGKITISPGGVGRNILENLARLGADVSFITALGKDLFGREIVKNLNSLKIDYSQTIFHETLPTAFYLLIVNELGKLDVGISDTEIIKEININYIAENQEYISKHDIIVLDANLEVDTIEYIVENNPTKKIFIDLVSIAKAKKLKAMIGKFHTIKPNLTEAEMISGIQFQNNSDLIKMKDWFLKQGVKQVFISMGEEGAFYANQYEQGIIKVDKVNVLNVSGAGDAFMSGLVFAEIKGKDIQTATRIASVSAIVALGHRKAVNPNTSETLLKENLKNLKIITHKL